MLETLLRRATPCRTETKICYYDSCLNLSRDIERVSSTRKPNHIPPKRPYSFEAMLADVLSFAASTLVPEGRISLWMPTANDEAIELGVPQHRALQLINVCTQSFNKCKHNLSLYSGPCAPLANFCRLAFSWIRWTIMVQMLIV